MNTTNKVTPADFGFESFKFTRIEFIEENSTDSLELAIEFDVKGTYYKNDGKFKMSLETITFNKGNRESPIWKITMVAIFKFSQPIDFDKIPSYFYGNILGISFPHIRSFFASTSLSANARIVFLPLLNLTGLEENLKQNTTVV